MIRSTLCAMTALLLGASTAAADTVISMPLPQGFSALTPTSGVSALAASLTAQISTSPSNAVPTPSAELFQQGIESLERYAAKSGRTRNHYLPTGYVTAGGFRTGTQFYSSYEGPGGWGWGGWGWWGSPIWVNNYFCDQPSQGGVSRPRTGPFGRGDGICGVGRFTGIAVGF